MEHPQDGRYRALFRSSRVPEALLDRDGVVSDVNEALCALLGQERAELVGHPLATHPDDVGLLADALPPLLRDEQDAVRGQVLLRGGDGGPVPVLADATLLRDEQGRPAGAGVAAHALSGGHEHVQEEFLAALSTGATEISVVSDRQGRLLYASPAVEHVFGYRVQDVQGSDGWHFVHPDDLAAARRTWEEVLRSGGARTYVFRLQKPCGAWRWVEGTATNFLDTSVGGVVCHLRDVTERLETERRLRESEMRFRAIADTAEEGIWAVRPDGRTLYANGRLASILGVPIEQVYEQSIEDLVGGQLDAEVTLRRTDRERRGAERYEVGYRHPDGAERRVWISAAPLRLADGTYEGSLAMVSDVTEARRAERELRHAVLHDALTGLPNRTLLRDRLEHALVREQSATAVLCLDLDHFKLVNDSRGHAVGDQLLVAAAARLVAAAGPGGAAAAGPAATVARSGGDEFVVVCEDCGPELVHTQAQRLLDALAEPFAIPDGAVHLAASVGMAVSPPRRAADLLRFADMAMYAAKSAGRGRMRLFDAVLADDAERRYALAADLRAALAEDALALHYQPVVDLHSGQVVGMEALARWTHPRLGPVPPTRFVAVAEVSGLASELDRWALRRALREAGRLRDRGALRPGTYVAVNLSAHDLGRSGLEELLVGWAEQAALPPAQVVLEITETAIMADPASAIAVLARLRDRGFQVAVDDFGTGHSSLAYLRDLPITSLKIDRSFVADISDDHDALAIVASILDLAQAVGIGVVAEGVETAQQADLLRDLGCGLGQGWLWSKAVAPGTIEVTDEWRTGHPVRS